MRNPFQYDLGESVRGSDVADFCDLIWANASRRAVAASPSSHSSVSSPSGLPSLSQSTREGAEPNKTAPRNS
jgi:hypothetical protein